MIRNYLKIAWRNLLRSKVYATINLTGLATGMAAAGLILLWVQYEWSFDRMYPSAGRLYQVYNRDKINGEMFAWETTPPPLAPVLQRDFPEVQAMARRYPTAVVLSAGEKHFNVSGAVVDSSFAGMFGLPVLEGNISQAFDKRQSIVLMASLAKRLFGKTDVRGGHVRIGRDEVFEITGVLEDIPANSAFRGTEFLLPWSYMSSAGDALENWNNNNFHTYLLLKENTDVAAFEHKIKNVSARHLTSVLKDVSNRSIFLHPAEKWHLYSKIENGQLTDGRIVTVRLFAIIAGFILLIACVNFVNLATARSERRAREVGVRKVAGAPRSNLIFQFLFESVGLAILAGVLAFGLIVLALPYFNNLLNTQIVLNYHHPVFWVAAFIFVLFTGTLAGIYPAIILSGLEPSKVLKSAKGLRMGGFSLRRVLVVLQFSFAFVLIISTLFVRQQIRFAEGREKGYKTDQLIFVPLTDALDAHYESFRQDLTQAGAAVSVTRSIGPITQLNTRQWGLSWAGSTDKDKDTEFVPFAADRDFLKTNGAKMVAGREIDIAQFATDSTAIVLNEAAVEAMRLANPIGATVRFSKRDWHVVGVVADFIYASPFEDVAPCFVAGPAYHTDWLSIKLTGEESSLVATGNIFKKYDTQHPFDYVFADQSYAAKFADEVRTEKLASVFTGLAILISCLGVFGLAAYAAQQRTKEIGIRKVLGATSAGIVRLLSTEFVVLVLVAFAIASPVAWIVSERWLDNYRYRIAINWMVFAVTLVCSVSLVLLTVGYQALRAAWLNPVKSLRNE